VIVDGVLGPAIGDRAWEIFGDATPGQLLPDGLLRVTNVDGTD
jgi:hypothetical protein